MFYDSPGSQQTQHSLFSQQVRHTRTIPLVLYNLKIKDSGYERMVGDGLIYQATRYIWQKVYHTVKLPLNNGLTAP